MKILNCNIIVAMHDIVLCISCYSMYALHKKMRIQQVYYKSHSYLVVQLATLDNKIDYEKVEERKKREQLAIIIIIYKANEYGVDFKAYTHIYIYTVQKAKQAIQCNL